MKKVLCILLSVMLVMCAFGTTAFAAVGSTVATGDASGTTGACSWSFSSATKTLRIYGNGAMADTPESSPIPWMEYGAETVIIENGVTHIGNNSFFMNTSIKQLSIADSVKSIGDNAFSYCTSLTTLTLPKNLETIGTAAFMGCSGITGEIVIPDDLEDVGKDAFRSCRSISKVSLGAKTDYVSESAFMDCYMLESADCKNVTTISKYAFKNCINLQKIDVSSASVILEEAFANDIMLSVIETSSDLVFAMGAFKGSNLTAVVFTSRMCVLESEKFGADSIPEKTIIYGYEGSSAERYATKYSRRFIAIADNDTVISKVELNITDPEAGKKPSYEATIPAAYANQYRIDDFSTEDGTWTHGVAWYDVTEGRRITPDEKFKGGHAYEVCAYLTPKQGYRFYFSQSGTAGGTINGKAAKFEYNKPDTRNPMIFYDYDALAVTYTDITEMDLSVTAPAYRTAPATEAQITAEGITVTDVSWSGLSEGETFEAGIAYTVTVSAAADEGYRITADAAAKINDANADVKVADDGLTAAVSYTFAPLEDPRTAIGNIALTVTAPAAAAAPIDQAQTDADGVTVAAVAWSVVENGDPVQMEPGAVFEAGKTYMVTVTINVDDDHCVTEDTTAAVNGENASFEDLPVEERVTCAVTYTFPALPNTTPGVLLGDVDGDGFVNIFDASAIQKRIANAAVSTFNVQAADVDGDGEITIFDASLIQKFLAGIPVIYPINEPLS